MDAGLRNSSVPCSECVVTLDEETGVRRARSSKSKAGDRGANGRIFAIASHHSQLVDVGRCWKNLLFGCFKRVLSS